VAAVAGAWLDWSGKGLRDGSGEHGGSGDAGMSGISGEGGVSRRSGEEGMSGRLGERGRGLKDMLIRSKKFEDRGLLRALTGGVGGRNGRFAIRWDEAEDGECWSCMGGAMVAVRTRGGLDVVPLGG
jgi:hypothetical protein